MKNSPRIVLVSLAAVVVLASTWMFLGHRRAYAQGDTPTPQFTIAFPSTNLGADQFATVNALNLSSQTVGATLSINNEDGTSQTPSTSISVPPQSNASQNYQPPQVTEFLPGGPSEGTQVGENFYVTITTTTGVPLGPFCASMTVRNDTTGDTDAVSDPAWEGLTIDGIPLAEYVRTHPGITFSPDELDRVKATFCFAH